MALRRARGILLRLVRRRSLAVVVGLALVIPAAWIEFSGRFDAWWVNGLALVAGATGLAVLWTGLTGPSPDWIETEPEDQNLSATEDTEDTEDKKSNRFRT